MEDETIIDLYFAREERAIAETGKKYGGYCRPIAFHLPPPPPPPHPPPQP